MSNYWKERQKLWKELERDEAKLTKELEKFYKVESKKLEREIAHYYSQYGEGNVLEYRHLLLKLPNEEYQLLIQDMDRFAMKYPEYGHLMPARESAYRINRLEGLQESIYLQQLEMGAEEQGLIRNHLEGIAMKGYGGSMNATNKAFLDALILNGWANNENFSQRIWANREALARHLQTKFRDAVIRGDTYADCVKALMEKFVNMSKADAYRLIYTEGTYVMNEATIRPFEEEGFTHYTYSAILDSKTSEVCEELNGQTFAIKDRQAGVNFPPMHPRCRSSFTVEGDKIDKID